MLKQSLQSKRVVVMGLGRFGGGVGVTRHLISRGADVLVTDTAKPEQLQKSLAALDGLPVTYRLGEHRVSDFTNADMIVVNPAVDQRKNEFLQAATAAGVALTSEIRLFISQLPESAKTIGVTGSAGKSTVVAMIGHILNNAKKQSCSDQASNTKQDKPKSNVYIGGNIGGSLLEKVDDITADDWVVLELSSFMLEGMAEDRWSPTIAVATNIAPNHLDRHGTLEKYAAAKQVILDHQSNDHVAILGQGVLAHMQPHTPHVTIISGDDGLAPISTLRIPGRHNLINAHMAIAACRDACNFADAADAMASFGGLPHRMQLIAEFGDVRFFNDSKATTPDATMHALTGFDPDTVHLIVGGYDKGSDLLAVAQHAATHCHAIYTIGDTGNTIAQAAKEVRGRADICPCQSLDQAVEKIIPRLRPNDVVLLSPACASYGQFENFEHRGNAFAEAVLRYTGEDAPRPTRSAHATT